jgi:hypothetical protein
LPLVDRFGVLAVYGRTPSAGELRRLLWAETVLRAWRAFHGEQWIEWSVANPDAARLFYQAMKGA